LRRGRLSKSSYKDKETIMPCPGKYKSNGKMRNAMDSKPSETTALAVVEPKGDGCSGRNAKGQFTKGNKPTGGRANQPMVKMRAKLQAALQAAVTEADIMDIVKGLIAKAKGGDVAAAREVLDRVIGKAEENVKGEITITVTNYAGASGHAYKFAS
jgi:hypothetical protein